MSFISPGFNSLINEDRIIAMTTTDSSPLRHLIGRYRDEGKLIDLTSGRSMKSIIFTDSGHIILSYLAIGRLYDKDSEKYVKVDCGCVIRKDKILTVQGPDASPVKRMIQYAKKNGRLVDLSFGKKTRSVIFTDTDNIILSGMDSFEIIKNPEIRYTDEFTEE